MSGPSITRWWFSWRCYEDDWRAVSWPMPDAWLGYWCSGQGDDYYNLVGWVEADDEEGVAALVSADWPDWNGEWRIDPSEKPNPPGDRFGRPDWTSAERWDVGS